MWDLCSKITEELDRSVTEIDFPITIPRILITTLEHPHSSKH